MMKNLLFKGLMPAVLLLAGVVTANADTKPAVTITVKDCVYGSYKSGDTNTGKYTQTNNGNKEVAYLNDYREVYYLGEINVDDLYSIEVKGAIFRTYISSTDATDQAMAQMRLTSFPANTYASVTTEALSHRSSESGYESIGINEKCTAASNIFLNASLETLCKGVQPYQYKLQKGADLFINDKGVAVFGGFNGTYNFNTAISGNNVNKISTSALGTGNRQLFLYMSTVGQKNAELLIDQIVFHYKNAATATYTLTVGDAKAATICLPYHSKKPAGITAYTLEYTGGDEVTATEVTAANLTAQVPYLINAEPGEYVFESTKNYWAVAKDNALAANWATEYVVPADNYILTMKDGKVGFRKADGTTNKVNAFHCYLKPEAAGAREFLGIDFGETSAVEGVQTKEQEAGVVYNLQGVRVENPTKGIYVKNGKKFIVK